MGISRARDYQTKANDIPKAITFYKEIVRLFPYTVEAEYAKIQPLCTESA